MSPSLQSSHYRCLRLSIRSTITPLFFLVLSFSLKASADDTTTTPLSNTTDVKWHCGECLCNETHVDCYDRNLTKIPAEHFPLTAETINLQYNKIAHLPERIFSNFTSLKYLVLTNNTLKRLSVRAFAGLENLYELNIAWNHLPLTDDAYPPGVFLPLNASLVCLRMEGNCDTKNNRCTLDDASETLAYPDKALSDLKHLNSLYIDGLPDTDFGLGFAKMTSLQRLHLLGFTGGYCNLSILTNETFVNLPERLHLLNMSDCKITAIEPNTFGLLRKLNTLDLSFNEDLGFDRLADAVYGLQGSKLKTLIIDNIVHRYSMSVTITPWHTRYFRNTSIERISACFNQLEMFCEGALNNLPDTLKNVNLFANRLGFGRYFRDFGKLTNLKQLYVDGRFWPLPIPRNYPLPSSPQQCHGPGSEGRNCERKWVSDSNVFETWRLDPEFMVVEPRITSLPSSDGEKGLTFVLPPKLEILKSRCNQLYYQLQRITIHPNNSLHTLDLSSNLLAVWLGPIMGVNLTTLNLANNFAHNVSLSFFNTLTSLTTFNASRNNLRKLVEEDENGTLFEPLVNLQVLDLSMNDINTISKKLFQGLFSLRSLYLAKNEIVIFDVNLDHMMHLRMLDLTFNGIHYFPQDTMSHLDNIAALPNSEVYVAIYYNPIACTCMHIDFLMWVVQSAVHFNKSDYYFCLTKDGSSSKPMNEFFGMIRELERSCTDYTGILVGAVSCCFCLMVALLSALAYRFRWKLRYLYYASRLKYSRIESDDDDSFEYDAFVSYASEDGDFVHGELLERLEQRAGLRLNVHNRDWVPGRPIPTNIVGAVQSSRRTLVILTRQLLESDWCQYEMQMATMEAVHTGRDVLLFLLYEDVPSHELPRQVFYNLQNSTYIQYPRQHLHDDRLVNNFWQRLTVAIKSTCSRQ